MTAARTYRRAGELIAVRVEPVDRARFRVAKIQIVRHRVEERTLQVTRVRRRGHGRGLLGGGRTPPDHHTPADHQKPDRAFGQPLAQPLFRTDTRFGDGRHRPCRHSLRSRNGEIFKRLYHVLENDRVRLSFYANT